MWDAAHPIATTSAVASDLPGIVCLSRHSLHRLSPLGFPFGSLLEVLGQHSHLEGLLRLIEEGV